MARQHINKQEVEEQERQYLEWQKEFNETGDRNILFFKMVPYLEQVIESNLVRMTNGNRTAEIYKGCSQEAALIVAKRYVKGLKAGKPYSKDKPRTLAYWAAVMMNRTYRDRWLSPVVYDRLNVEDLKENE